MSFSTKGAREEASGDTCPDENGAAPHRKGRVLPVLLSLIIVALIALAVALLSMRQYTVVGTSMEPTLEPGDRVSYVGFSQIQYNDLVIFDAGEVYGRVVKRVVGLPGDNIEVTSNGQLVRNHVLVEEPYLLPDALGNSGMPEIIVAADMIFVMGDHRAESIDSRDIRIGQISQDAVLGVVTGFVRQIEKR